MRDPDSQCCTDCTGSMFPGRAAFRAQSGARRGHQQQGIHMIKTVMAAALALGVAASGANAKAGIKIGVLTCNVEGGIGYIIGSSKDVSCTYKSVGGNVERYGGSIGKLGVDIGITKDTVIVWAVFAPGKVSKGALSGTYLGATAEATVIAGLGANVLVGGFRKTINLQPVSVQAQTGLNVAAGVASLHLKAKKVVSK